ncbi:MAG: CRISPR-associated endonuclease Cas1 [Leptolyngbyaceae cyanobacterium CSU_1_3]|nr:CRISPR-associated endonuclease Cas1 [Leptolyngbyaceae cyanobacterium CSU_1_3]
MQLALLESLKARQQPIPPPLYVVLGYEVREIKPIKIVSQEKIWRTSMATAYLVDQGSVVYKQDDCFRIKRPKKDTIEVPIREVERILVLGNVQISTSAISVCLEEQIPVVFLTQLGDYKGHLWSAEFCDLPVEAAQYGRRNDPGFQLGMARRIVVGKVVNSKQLLLRLNRKRQVKGLRARIKR